MSDYPASTWTLAYKLVGSGGVKSDAVVTTSGNDFAVTIPAAKTKDYTAGFYTLIGYVISGLEQYTVCDKIVEVQTYLSGVAAATDTRTHARKTLALIEAAIESYAVRPVEQISIAGRTITRPTLAQLLGLRSRYMRLVADEVKAENIANGLQSGGRILTRFRSTT